MKTLVILACILANIAITFAQSSQEMVLQPHLTEEDTANCMKEVDITMEEMDSIQNMKEENLSKEESKKLIEGKFACFIACRYERGGIMKDDKIQTDAACKMENERARTTDDPQICKKVEACVAEANLQSNKCLTALSFLMCIW